MISVNDPEGHLKGIVAIKDSWIQLLREIAHDHKYSVRSVEFHAVGRGRILELNESLLGHSYETDIITMEESEVKEVLEATIWVCPEVISENARNLRLLLADEVLRVLIHGILHLVGYDDKNPDDQVIMRRKEDEYLSRLN